MKILYSSRFLQKYGRLPQEVKEKAEKKEEIFRKNPFDERLKIHKLRGRMNEFWAFSVDIKYRIILKFEDSDKVRFYTIGGHSIYF